MSTPPTSLLDNLLGGTTAIHFVANSGEDDTQICFPWMEPYGGGSLSSIMEERTGSCTESPIARISVDITPPTSQAPTETTRRSGSKRSRGNEGDDGAAGVDTSSGSGGEPPRSLMRRVEEVTPAGVVRRFAGGLLVAVATGLNRLYQGLFQATSLPPLVEGGRTANVSTGHTQESHVNGSARPRSQSVDSPESYLMDSDPLLLAPFHSHPSIRTIFHRLDHDESERDDSNTFTPRDNLELRYPMGGIYGDADERGFEFDEGETVRWGVNTPLTMFDESLLAAFLPQSLPNAMSFLALVTLPQYVPSASRVVSEDRLRALETFHVRDPIEGAIECSICQFALSEQPTPDCLYPGCSSETVLLVEMPACGHVFHRVCLLPWLRTSTTCPNCRSEFTTTTPN